MRRILSCGAVAALLFLGGGEAGHAQARKPIILKPDAVYKHQHSKLRLPPVLGSLPRASGVEAEDDQLDVFFEYSSPGGGEVYTVYIFRNVAGSVPVWFDRARWMIENRTAVGNARWHPADQSFVPPGRTTASGLKAVYEVAGQGFRSTGVAIVPIDGWYVKLRASSETLSPAQLDSRMMAVLAALDWPDRMSPAPVAVPVEDCAVPLALTIEAEPAERGPASAASILSTAIHGAVESSDDRKKSERRAPEPSWCRDPARVESGGVYRADSSKEAYLVAISDAGRALLVGPSYGDIILREGAQDDSKPAFTVELILLSQRLASHRYDRLPPPSQAMTIAQGGRFASSTPTWGSQKGKITLSSDALK